MQLRMLLLTVFSVTLIVMDFNGLLDQLRYGAQKTLGNTFFPQATEDKMPQMGGPAIQKKGSRGPIGDALASRYYVPPLESPLPDAQMNQPAAIKSHPLEFRKEDVLAASTQQSPQSFDQLTKSMSPAPSRTSSPPVPTPTLLPNAPENPYMDLIRQHFPDDQVNNASNVMFKESSFNPDSIGVNTGGTRDYGLYQINDKWQAQNLAKRGMTIDDMLDPQKNIEFTSWLQQQNGWNPWYGADSLGLTNR